MAKFIENRMLVDSEWEEEDLRDEEEIERDYESYWDHIDSMIDEALGK